jgi:hypothetical protein
MKKKTGISAKADVFMESTLGRDWSVFYRWLLQDGMPVISEIRIYPLENPPQDSPGEWTHAAAPTGGIKMSLLRQIHVSDVRKRMAEAMEMFQQQIPDLMQMTNFVPAPPKDRTARKEKRGRPAIADLEYVRIANYYAERCAHESLKPIADTARRFKKLTRAKVRSRLHEARRRGLLSFGQRGIAWGMLTDKARQLLNEKKGA